MNTIRFFPILLFFLKSYFFYFSHLSMVSSIIFLFLPKFGSLLFLFKLLKPKPTYSFPIIALRKYIPCLIKPIIPSFLFCFHIELLWCVTRTHFFDIILYKLFQLLNHRRHVILKHLLDIYFFAVDLFNTNFHKI